MTKIIIASGPVIVEDNRVLLDKHGDDKFWKFCGGRVEGLDADLQTTAVAKAKKELGIEVEILNPEPFLLFMPKEKTGGEADAILAHFMAKRLGEIKPGSDIREWKWVSLADLAKEDLAPNIIPTLKHFGHLA